MVNRYTRKNEENKMFLDDTFMEGRDLEAAIAFADMLDSRSDGLDFVAPGVRIRSKEEQELIAAREMMKLAEIKPEGYYTRG